MTETKTSKYRRRLSELKTDSYSWRQHWQEIHDYLLPRKGRFLQADDEKENDGARRDSKIINAAATKALEVLSAGMQGGLTSPSRPWFNLTLSNKPLAQKAAVKVWLDECKRRILHTCSQSNFYSATHSTYQELAAFGTGVVLIEPDNDKVIRCKPFTVGEYYLGLNARYKPDSIYRRFSMTAGNLIDEFGKENVSSGVKSSYDQGSLESLFKVIHVIQPRDKFDDGKLDSRNMPYESIYFEESGDHDTLLRESGYRSQPFAAARWSVEGSDTYGRSPGMTALGDVKMLQKMESKKLTALDKGVDPPMVAPPELKKQGGGTTIPGGVNYVSVTTGGQGFAPAYQVNMRIAEVGQEVLQVVDRISRIFFNDLFLSFLGVDKNMTATEVDARRVEKLLQLGPVIELLQAELLSPMIDRIFEVMLEAGQLPPPPPELFGQELDIEYVGLLAQAQKATDTAAIEQFGGFVANLAVSQANAGQPPSVMDKIDMDQMVDEYGDRLGVPPKTLRSDREVASIRAMRQEQMRAQEALQQAGAAAQAAKTASEAKMGDKSVLDVLTEVR